MKRTLSFVLCFCLIFSMVGTALVGTAGAVSYNDVAANNWAIRQITYMSEKGILQGNLGNFRPDDYMTKAEFIKVLNYTFGLKQTTYGNYSDVSTSKWYYADIMKAAANGYLTTNGYYVGPDEYLTREEACALVARYLRLEAKSSYSSFIDASQISPAYRSYVIACVEAGIINGIKVSNGYEFRAKGFLERDDASTIVYKMAGSIYNTSAYGTDVNAYYTNGVVNTSGVTVSNANLSGTVYVTEGTENGTVTFQNCTINGTLKVVGATTVYLVDTSVSNLVVDTTSGYPANILVSGTSTVANTTVKSAAKLTNNSTYDNYGFRTVTSSMDANATLTLDGKFPTVAVAAPYNNIVLADADTEISALTVAQGAVSNKITGTGKIADAKINAAGAVYDMVPAKFSIANGITATFAGKQYTGTGVEQTYPKFYLVDNALEIKAKEAVSGTLYYMIVANNATAPTAQQVVNNTYYSSYVVDAGAINLVAGVENTDTSIALSTATNYDVYTYFRATNAAIAGNPEKVDIYTTSAPTYVAGYPTYGTLTYVNNTTASYTITVRTTGACTAYAIAVPKNSYVAPTASQIYETATGTGTYNPYVTVASRAVKSVSANYTTSVTLEGLSYNGNYDYYIVLGNGVSPVSLRTVYTPVATDDGFDAGTPVIIETGYEAVGYSYLKLKASSGVPGRVFVKTYAAGDTRPTAAEIYNNGNGSNYRLTYNSVTGRYDIAYKDGQYSDAQKITYSNRNSYIAAVYVPDSSVYTTYAPVYAYIAEGNILTMVGTATNAPVMTVKAPAKTTEAASVVYTQKMQYNNYALSALNAATLKSLFTVKDASGAAVDFTATVNDVPGYTTVLIIPATATPWTAGATYTVTASDKIVNASNVAPTIKTGSFKIAVVAPTAPIATIEPDTGVAVSDAEVKVTFSEKMYALSTDNVKVEIDNDNADDFFKVYDEDDNLVSKSDYVIETEDSKVFTFTFDELALETKYVIKINENLINNSNAKVATKSVNFTTVSKEALANPVITVFTTVDGSTVATPDKTTGKYTAGKYYVVIEKAKADKNDENVTLRYTLDGKAVKPTSDEVLSGRIEVTVTPNATLTINAKAYVTTASDKDNSEQATLTLEGAPVTIAPSIASESAIKSTDTITLSATPVTFNENIVYVTVEEALTAAKQEEAIRAAASTSSTGRTLEGKNVIGMYVYAAAVKDGDLLGPIMAATYYALPNDIDLIVRADGEESAYVETGDKIYIATEDGEYSIDVGFKYDLYVAIMQNGTPLTSNGFTYDGTNKMSSGSINFEVKEAANTEIVITATLKDPVGEQEISQTKKFFANPAAPVINLTTGEDEDAVTTDITGTEANVNYNEKATISFAMPTNEAWTEDWTEDWTIKTTQVGLHGKNGGAAVEIPAVTADYAISATATVAGKDVTATADIKVQPVSPKLYNEADEEMKAAFTSADRGTYIAKGISGADNKYQVTNAGTASDPQPFASDNKPFTFGNEESPKVITLWSEIKVNGEVRSSKEYANVYTITKTADVVDAPSITVVKDDGTTWDGKTAVVGDEVVASTPIESAEVDIKKDGTSVYTELPKKVAKYVIAAVDAGKKITFTTDIPDDNYTYSIDVIVLPNAPEVTVDTAANTANLLVRSTEGVISGFKYAYEKEIANLETASGITATANKWGAYSEDITDGNFTNGYDLTVVSYVTIGGTNYYSAPVTKTNASVAAPEFDPNGGIIAAGEKVSIIYADGAALKIGVMPTPFAEDYVPATNWATAEYEISTDNIGDTLYFAAQVSKDNATSDVTKATFYVRPANIAGKVDRVMTAESSVYVIYEPTADGFVYKLVGQDEKELRWEGQTNNRIFATNGAEVEYVRYFYEAEGADDTALFTGAKAGYVYSADAATIGEVPVVTAIKNGNTNVLDTEGTVLYIIGTDIVIETNLGDKVSYKAYVDGSDKKVAETVVVDRAVGKVNTSSWSEGTVYVLDEVKGLNGTNQGEAVDAIKFKAVALPKIMSVASDRDAADFTAENPSIVYVEGDTILVGPSNTFEVVSGCTKNADNTITLDKDAISITLKPVRTVDEQKIYGEDVTIAINRQELPTISVAYGKNTVDFSESKDVTVNHVVGDDITVTPSEGATWLYSLTSGSNKVAPKSDPTAESESDPTITKWQAVKGLINNEEDIKDYILSVKAVKDVDGAVIESETYYVTFNVIPEPAVERVAIDTDHPVDLEAEEKVLACKAEDVIWVKVANASGVKAEIDGKSVEATEGKTAGYYSLKALDATVVEELVLTPYVVIGEGEDAETINGEEVTIALDYAVVPTATVPASPVSYVVGKSDVSVTTTGTGIIVAKDIAGTNIDTIDEIKAHQRTVTLTGANANLNASIKESLDVDGISKIYIAVVPYTTLADGRTLEGAVSVIEINEVVLPTIASKTALIDYNSDVASDFQFTVAGEDGKTYAIKAEVAVGDSTITGLNSSVPASVAANTAVSFKNWFEGRTGGNTGSVVLTITPYVNVNGVDVPGEAGTFRIAFDAITGASGTYATLEEALSKESNLVATKAVEVSDSVKVTNTFDTDNNVVTISGNGAELEVNGTLIVDDTKNIVAINGGKLIVNSGASFVLNTTDRGPITVIGPDGSLFLAANTYVVIVTNENGGYDLEIYGDANLNAVHVLKENDTLTVKTGTLTIKEGVSLGYVTDNSVSGDIVGSVVKATV